MVVNAIALVFVTLLIFAGLWLVNMMARSSPANLILTEISETLQWWGAEG
jgi:hypothetical protein